MGGCASVEGRNVKEHLLGGTILKTVENGGVNCKRTKTNSPPWVLLQLNEPTKIIRR